MGTLETVKELAERVTGAKRPAKRDLFRLVQPRKCNTYHFRDDGVIPNHPFWPLIVYRTPVRLPERFEPAAVFEEVFASNGWRRSWRNGVYDYAHFHSRIHEVLGVARGEATVRFGGDDGRRLDLKAGDVAVLPAGTGHQLLSASDDFLVVGAYPASGAYDECRSKEDHSAAVKAIIKASAPAKDPVFGRAGPLVKAWRKPAAPAP